jgi:hypothetical protein
MRPGHSNENRSAFGSDCLLLKHAIPANFDANAAGLIRKFAILEIRSVLIRMFLAPSLSDQTCSGTEFRPVSGPYAQRPAA